LSGDSGCKQHVTWRNAALFPALYSSWRHRPAEQIAEVSGEFRVTEPEFRASRGNLTRCQPLIVGAVTRSPADSFDAAATESGSLDSGDAASSVTIGSDASFGRHAPIDSDRNLGMVMSWLTQDG
jgi:hypothetical protein